MVTKNYLHWISDEKKAQLAELDKEYENVLKLSQTAPTDELAASATVLAATAMLLVAHVGDYVEVLLHKVDALEQKLAATEPEF